MLMKDLIMQKIKDEIIAETIREIGIDPTERLNGLSDQEILKEFRFLQTFEIGE